ncbi:hypothetical protein ACWDYJ_34390 [Streptomyces sp. NPDC003042]
MKLKRIAFVAAAAVVGPTVLMASPAMADEVQKPAVTTPDAAPKDDTAKPEAEATPVGAAKESAKQSVGQERPWGPKLSLENLPAAGFVAGGNWSEATLKVDNSGLKAVDDYALELRVTGSALKASYFDVEVFHAGAWHTAAPMPAIDAPVYDLTPGLSYGAGSVTELKVRMRATAAAPAADIKVHVSGTDHRDVDSKVASYPSKITHSKTDAGDGIKAGAPNLTLDGLPTHGFKAGDDWREFALHVDNSGRAAVDDYSLELVLWTLDTAEFQDGDIQLEMYAPDSAGTWAWRTVEAYGSEEAWSLGLAEVDIEKNEVFDLKLRMKFDKDVPPTRISLDTTAEGGSAERVKHRTVLTAPDGQALRHGPKLALNGLPKAGFKAGGGWESLALNVDNSGKEAIDKYTFTLFFFNDGKHVLRAEHLDIEIWNGKEWVAVEKDPTGSTPGAIFDWAVGKNAKFDIQLRVRATADAPACDVVVILYADSNGSDQPVDSPMVVLQTSVVTSGTSGDGNGNGNGNGDTDHDTGGNKPSPDGGSKPVDNSGSTGGNTNTGSPATGGELARTGTDSATSWALGASGMALALGAAFVVGTGRRRRPTA